jgi:triphosphoribosyl-dephospho-CoA synthetase
MHYGTFVSSAFALAPFWSHQFREGLSGLPPREVFPRLRSRGVAMEEAMFRATNNINTHKGLIFVLSLLLYGTGKAREEGAPLSGERICTLGGSCVAGMVGAELEPLKKSLPPRPLTHGERLYLEHGITGIRGEAEGGFPALWKTGLPALEGALEEGHSLHHAGLYALLHLMLATEDSTVIHRGGHAFWKTEYREMIRKVLHKGAPFSSSGEKALEELDGEFSRRRISPGGAADLLSATFFLHFCLRRERQMRLHGVAAIASPEERISEKDMVFS